MGSGDHMTNEIWPRIILVSPLYEWNLGSIARAMKNFGLFQLFLVKPKATISSDALRFAMKGVDVLEKAIISNEIEDALKGVDFIIGTTAREGDAQQNLLRMGLTPRRVFSSLPTLEGVAILFGREDEGLHNEELDLCDLVVSIPTSVKYKTMNLSHAAAVIFYELSQAKLSRRLIYKPAKKLHKKLLLTSFESMVGQSGFPEHKRKLMIRAFSNVISRASISNREVTLIIGAIRRVLNEKHSQ